MLTIILDAATDLITVILANGDRVITKRSSKGKALELLHVYIRDVLQYASVRMSDIQRVGVIEGPGSWTGLHIAISSAKTLAQAYRLPLIPISFIDALAVSCQQHEGLLAAIYDSPNGKIFYRSYEASGDRVVPITEHQKLSASELVETLKGIGGAVKLVGGISPEVVTEIEQAGVADITLEHISYPSEDTIAKLVNDASSEGKSMQDLIFLEPLYLQSADEGPRLFKER
jgi:tRNA threonylcarbamoyladenosine biosynthesis protein TsaB